jgi:hypothetical protein
MPSSDRRGAARLGIKLLMLALPFVLLSAVVEVGLRRMPSTYSVKKAILERRLTDTEILITGHSQSLEGIDPAVLGPHAVSAANLSQSLYYDARIVSLYLDRLPRLRLVVIPLSYFSLRYRIPDSAEPWRMFFYRSTWGIPEESAPRCRIHPRNYLYLANYGNVAAVRSLLKGFRSDPGIDGNGWQPVRENDPDKEYSINDATARKRLAFHAATMREEALQPNLGALDDLIGRLRARGIAVALIDTPVYATYRRNMDGATYRELLREAADLAARHGIEFRDYLADDRFTLDDFYDNDHLNASGAERFSRILLDEVVAPLLGVAPSETARPNFEFW